VPFATGILYFVQVKFLFYPTPFCFLFVIVVNKVKASRSSISTSLFLWLPPSSQITSLKRSTISSASAICLFQIYWPG
jgi:hypothetical protein